MRLIKLRLSSLFDAQLTKKNYLQISAFLDLMIIEQEEVFHTIQKKTIGKAMSKVIKKRLA